MCAASWRAALARIVALGLTCAASSAAARELDYRAPAGCPSRDAVLVRLTDAGRPALIHVRGDDAGGFRGELVLGAGDTRVARVIEGRSCASVIQALVLVVALDAVPAAETPDARPLDDPRPGAAPDDPPGTEAPNSPPRAKGPDDSPPSADASVGTAPAASLAHLELAAGLALSGTSFAEGSVLPGGALFFGITSGPGLAETTWLRPSARLSVGATLATETGGGATIPRFDLKIVTLDACPLSMRVASELRVVACGRAEIGSLTAGVAGDPLSQTSRLWQDAGALVRAQWVLRRGSGARPMLEISVGMQAPLQRDRFHFGKELEGAIAAPPIQWMLALGGGVVRL